jgi:hypothetical protein
MRFHPTIAAALLLIILAPGAGAQAPPPDLALLRQWLTGEFDNFQQFYEAKDTKAPMPHERMHTVVTPLSAPSVGAHVLLARESALDEPDVVTSLHLYSLAPGPADGSIRLRRYAVADPSILAGVLKDPSKPVEIRLDQLTVMAGCDVNWRRDGDALVGATTPGACRTTWPKTGSEVTVTTTYRLTADEFWFAERLTEANGQLVSGRADGVPYKLKRARPFTCWTALRKDGTADQYDGTRNIDMHDQGKMVAFRDGEGKPTKYSFELSELRYSQQLPVMKLALYEAGKESAFAYTWTDPGSARIGINLRWIQAGCTAK